jgi:catechol 2,3-dioxygenase-like lactoylglutathione lyase family enzyme
MTLALVTLVVREYDEAIAFYVGTLGFTLVEDTVLEPGKRWVVVAPPAAKDGPGARLLLARAATPEQAARIGDQTGGRVAFFLHTDDIARDHAAWSARGVVFVRPPTRMPYGTVAVFRDAHGNLWDLIEPSGESAAP